MVLFNQHIVGTGEKEKMSIKKRNQKYSKTVKKNSKIGFNNKEVHIYKILTETNEIFYIDQVQRYNTERNRTINIGKV